MKKIILTAVMFMGMILTSQAQEIGIRFGGVAGVSNNNVAVDGVFSSGKYSRIHADVSFGDGVGIDALWDFVYKPLGDTPLKWYAGVGPSMIIINNYFGLGVSGEIGLEYQFDGVPISIGADWRPTFWIVEDTDFQADGFGLNIRYRF